MAFWKALRDDIDDLQIEDPANPTGNDLGSIFGDDERESLSAAATVALDLVDEGDGEVVRSVRRVSGRKGPCRVLTG